MATAAIARRLDAASARVTGTHAMSADPPLPHPDLVAAIPRLRRYARVLTGDATRADDLVQETLARGWEKRRLWAAGTDLRAWLFTIMHNVFVNQRATNVRDAQNVSLDGDGESLVELGIAVDIDALMGQFMENQPREIGVVLGEHRAHERVARPSQRRICSDARHMDVQPLPLQFDGGFSRRLPGEIPTVGNTAVDRKAP